MDYTVNVNATKACTLTVSTGSAPATPSTPSTPSTPTVTIKKGDANGDGAITIRDLADVRLHLLGLKKLSGDKAKAADVNGDGGIAIRDLADIRLHLLGLKTIK